MKLSVDRITDNIAVVEKDDMTHFEIDISVLPEGTKEGSILIYKNGIYTLDTDEEARRRSELFNKQRMLFGDRKKD